MQYMYIISHWLHLPGCWTQSTIWTSQFFVHFTSIEKVLPEHSFIVVVANESSCCTSTAVVWRQVEHDVLLTFGNIFISNQNISQLGGGGSSGEGQETSDYNFLTVLHINSRSILLSFRDVTTEQTTEDGPTTATIAHLPIRRVSSNQIKSAWFIG